MRRITVLVMLLLLPVALIACSDDGSVAAAPSPSEESSPTEIVDPTTELSPDFLDALSSAWTPLEKLPQDYSKEQAARDGVYVDIHGSVYANPETLKRFEADVEAGAAAFLRVMLFTIEGDPIITDYQFDGRIFTVSTDSSRDQYAAVIDRRIHTETWKYMILDPAGGLPSPGSTPE